MTSIWGDGGMNESVVPDAFMRNIIGVEEGVVYGTKDEGGDGDVFNEVGGTALCVVIIGMLIAVDGGSVNLIEFSDGGGFED